VKNQYGAMNLLAVPPIKGFRFVELTDFAKWRQRDELARFLKTSSRNLVCVFITSDRRPDTNNGFSQTIVRRGWWVNCLAPNEDQLVSYVEQKYNLKGDVAKAVVSASSDDLNALEVIMNKLKHLTDGRYPSLKDVAEARIGHSRNVFHLVDLICTRNTTNALQTFLYMVRVGRFNVSGFLSLLHRRFSELLKIKKVLGLLGSSNPHLISSELGIPLFVVTERIKQSERITFAGAVESLRLVSETDYSINALGMDYRLCLLILIEELTNV
jgi:DNA polymerase III delta subunit